MGTLVEKDALHMQDRAERIERGMSNRNATCELIVAIELHGIDAE